MTTSATPSRGAKAFLYALGAIVGLFVAYYGGCFLGVNLFLGLDWSLFGRLGAGGWPGWALLGLGLGMAAGATAAQRRYRLSRGLVGGAAALSLALVAGAVFSSRGRLPEDLPEAQRYQNSPGQGQCPACATAEASSTKTDPQNRYLPARLLDKDPTTAWISGLSVASDGPDSPDSLRLTLRVPPDQRLVGLRLGNGYGKSPTVYRSFGRARTARVRLNDTGPPVAWHLPDTFGPDVFIPLPSTPGAQARSVTIYLDAAYPGDNHAEVALSELVPIIAPLK